MKLSSLQDLKQVQKSLQAAHERELAEKAAREAQARQAEAARNLFARAVGAVQPLPDRKQARLPQVATAPVARQRQKDEQAVLQDALSDEFDASTLLDTDEALSFRRPGIGPDVTHKLRKGDWSIQREIDLHGLRSDEARLALSEFIRLSHRQGLRCVRVVHGKGLGSPGKTPVLKSKVHSWLVQKNQVMAFVQAKPAEGGAGALVVLLKPGG
jgi:DNA-nicking Smr family endonuclease